MLVLIHKPLIISEFMVVYIIPFILVIKFAKLFFLCNSFRGACQPWLKKKKKKRNKEPKSLNKPKSALKAVHVLVSCLLCSLPLELLFSAFILALCVSKKEEPKDGFSNTAYDYRN